MNNDLDNDYDNMTAFTLLVLNLLVDAAILLKPNLHPASPRPVWDLGVAAAAARDDVHIVVLSGARNKP